MVDLDVYELFTRKNIEIFNYLDKKRTHIREIADVLKISPAKVHETIQLFKKYNLVKEIEEKNRKIIFLDKKNPLFKKIKSILVPGEVSETEETINLYDNISPLDFRYYGRNDKIKEKLRPYLSESGFIKYLLKVEVALVKALAKNKLCKQDIADEIATAAKKVSAEEVYKEEDRIKHNIRALANMIRKNVSDKAKPYVHFTATSHDIMCSADAARFKDFTNHILVPNLVELEKTIINLAQREKNTIQIGRTHGQHAEPITFGFAIAQYVDRLGNSIIKIRRAANNLRGKLAGAVGAYSASSLFFNNPVEFEKDVLKELGILPSPISTQVVEPEFMADYVHALINCFGILANLADDMRHLQRSEINEIAESFGTKQVGSSTMPHKRNPINFENVKSMWKEFLPRIITTYMDQISEHQRDLTNSATQRFVPEIAAGLYVSVSRLNRIMSALVVDKESMQKNFDMNKGMITAEPAYILLAAKNHPDAHEFVRELTLEAQRTGKSFSELLFNDKKIRKYLKKLNKSQKEILKDPEKYLGLAKEKTDAVCQHWKKELKI